MRFSEHIQMQIKTSLFSYESQRHVAILNGNIEGPIYAFAILISLCPIHHFYLLIRHVSDSLFLKGHHLQSFFKYIYACKCSIKVSKNMSFIKTCKLNSIWQTCLKKHLEFFSERFNLPTVNKGVDYRVNAGEKAGDKD